MGVSIGGEGRDKGQSVVGHSVPMHEERVGWGCLIPRWNVNWTHELLLSIIKGIITVLLGVSSLTDTFVTTITNVR